MERRQKILLALFAIFLVWVLLECVPHGQSLCASVTISGLPRMMTGTPYWPEKTRACSVDLDLLGEKSTYRRMGTDAQKPLELHVKIERVHAKGNWFVPLYKDFALCYVVHYWGSENGEEIVRGNLEGEVQVKTLGIWSIPDIRRHASETARARIQEYFVTHLPEPEMDV